MMGKGAEMGILKAVLVLLRAMFVRKAHLAMTCTVAWMQERQELSTSARKICLGARRRGGTGEMPNAAGLHRFQA